MAAKEKTIRECAQKLHQCDERIRSLRVTNTPADPDEKMALSEEVAVAEAKRMRAYYALMKAKSDYAT